MFMKKRFALKLKSNPLLDRLHQELQPKQLLPSLAAGSISGGIGVTVSISFAALIFSGDLSPYVSTGIGIALFSSVIFRAIAALFSSFPGTIADTDALPSAVLALIAAAIGKQLAASATATEIFATIAVAIALISVLTGVFLLALGLFKVGKLIRFMPYPVVGGFLAGTGWLLVQGAIQVMTNVPITWANLPLLFDLDRLLRWLPGLLFATLLLIVSRRYHHFAILPTSLVAAVVLFYSSLWLTGTPLAEASTQGWLLGPFPQANLWQPLSLSELSQTHWSAIFDQKIGIVTIIMVSAPAILLTASGLELIVEQDINLNQELQIAGVANILAGLGGGMVGYHVLPDSVLAHRMGSRSRLAGLFAAILSAVVLLMGPSLLAFFPKLAIGGLLLFLGLSFLVEWLYDAWFKLPRAEYPIVLLILIAIGTVGFLPGVGVGLIASALLFAIQYSRIQVARHVLSGTTYSSQVQRFPSQTRTLRQKGERTYILQLHGSIFFGTANKLLEKIRQRLHNLSLDPLQFIVLDFRLVSGLDASAVLSFAKLKQTARKHKMRLVFTDVKPSLEKRLRQGQVLDRTDPLCQVFPDLDRGVAWCEEQILRSLQWRRPRSFPLALQLRHLFPVPGQVPRLMAYLEHRTLAVGEFLFRQGDVSEGLYFLESGQVSVILTLANQQMKQLQTYTNGTILGEIGLYNRNPRLASVVAERNSSLYYLSQQAFEQLELEDPHLAASFHKFIVSLLVERLKQQKNELQNLWQ